MTDAAEPAPLDAVRQATAKRAEAATVEAEWRDAIRAAIEAGERVVDIAAAAGVTRDRVYQIRDDRR